MKKRNDLKVVFKTYNQNQPMLLPPSLDELIGEHHPVHVVNRIVDAIDTKPLLSSYKAGGTSSYHPVMLLKVTVFAYMNNIYSSRKIEEQLQQNIHFMWLSGMSQPDHNTINRFRTERLKNTLEKIFTQVVELLAAEGLLSIEELYTDGTKIEANANRYSFVWGKAIATSKERVKKQLQQIIAYARTVAAEEMDDTDPSGFDEIDTEKVQQTIDKINTILRDKPVSKEIKQKLRYASKHWPQNLEKYKQQEKIIGENRSSYSKTDTDATFMRLKEDHMKNGQLKPAYNLQISTNNQFIVYYTLHQQTTDTGTLQHHLTALSSAYQTMPEVITADAGYGSEENYQFLENMQADAYVKYNYFDKEQKGTARTSNSYHPDNLVYDEKEDVFYCPDGKAMHCTGSHTKTTVNGYKQTIHTYQAKQCDGCPLRNNCHQQRGNRVIEVNHNLRRLKKKAKALLQTEKGIAHRKKRCYDVEPVFANLKQNHHFKRFTLRGLEKVTIESGLHAIAHNLRKKIKTKSFKEAA